MPVYTFHCKACENSFEVVAKMSEHDELRTKMYEDECPNCGKTQSVVRWLEGAGLVSPFLLGRYQPSDNFKSRLREIKKSHPTLDGSYL